MTDLERSITALETADANMKACTEEKMMAMHVYGGDRLRLAVADSHAKEAARELTRCKDNLCNFILKHKDEIAMKEAAHENL